MIRRDPFGATQERGHHRARPAGESKRHYIGAIIGAVVAAGSAAYAADQQAKAQSYQAKVADVQAQSANNAAAVEAQNRAEHYRRIMATSRANVGGSGVQPDTGSPLAVMGDSAEQAALDIARVKYTGQLRSTAYHQEADLKRYEATNTRRSGMVAAGASLLSGGAEAYGSYRKSQLRLRRYEPYAGAEE